MTKTVSQPTTPNTASCTSTGMICTRTPGERRGWRGGSRRVFRRFVWLEADSGKVALSRPTHQRVTHTVETVEKVPFRKLIFGKWDKNIEKRLVFCVPNNILAIFEPVVGDFCEDFSSKEFFDSLVRRLNTRLVY